jgi:hypothetical protein
LRESIGRYLASCKFNEFTRASQISGKKKPEYRRIILPPGCYLFHCTEEGFKIIYEEGEGKNITPH